MTCARDRRLCREAAEEARFYCLESKEGAGIEGSLNCEDDDCSESTGCPFFEEALREAKALDSLMVV
jgi:hypothetical protein